MALELACAVNQGIKGILTCIEFRSGGYNEKRLSHLSTTKHGNSIRIPTPPKGLPSVACVQWPLNQDQYVCFRQIRIHPKNGAPYSCLSRPLRNVRSCFRSSSFIIWLPVIFLNSDYPKYCRKFQAHFGYFVLLYYFVR